MKYIFFILLIAAFSFSQCAQKASHSIKNEYHSLANEIFEIVKKDALYRDSLNFDIIWQEIGLLPFDKNDSSNFLLLTNYFTDKLRAVGDIHSFIISKRGASSIRSREITNLPKASYAGDGVGVIKVPPCFSMDSSKDLQFANTIRTEIRRIDTTHTIRGWIVDLRQNTGGNMWPMLAGLNALLEDDTVGYFVFPSGKKDVPWLSRNGILHYPVGTIDNYKVRTPNLKIAVLIDEMTASSGEMTAISLIGLPNVRLFGYPSAGYTTANTSYTLSNGSILLLATSLVADRTKKTYQGKIVPDVHIKEASTAVYDAPLETAKSWILKEEQIIYLERADGRVNDSLSKVLELIYSEDQQYRNRLGYIRKRYGYASPEMKKVLDSMKTKDSVNILIVSRILDDFGWLGSETVGTAGSTALFLVIQHADLEVQVKYLPLLRLAVNQGKAKHSSLAMLEDRVAVRKELDQIYGSQIGWNMLENIYYLLPVKDPDSLDFRRAKVGLPPIEIYLKKYGMVWDLEQYKRDLPALRQKIRLDTNKKE